MELNLPEAVLSSICTTHVASPSLAPAYSSADEQNATPGLLASKLAMRWPYVAPLNILQAIVLAAIRELDIDVMQPASRVNSIELFGTSPRALTRYGSGLRSWHKDDKATEDMLALLDRDPDSRVGDDLMAPEKVKHALKDTLKITIKGIAAGMQNTG
jgi:phosphoenolpyruvate carboxylase